MATDDADERVGHGPTWREFDDFRKESRESMKALELKLWGLVIGMALLVIGSLYTQLARPQSASTAPAAAPSAALHIVLALVGYLH